MPSESDPALAAAQLQLESAWTRELDSDSADTLTSDNICPTKFRHYCQCHAGPPATATLLFA